MLDFFRVTATSLGTSVRVILATLRGMGSEGDDDNAEPVDNAQWMQPLGLMSRPKIPSSGNKITALVFRDGDEVHIFHVWDKSQATLQASDVDEGDTVLYSHGQPTCTLKLDKNGGITASVKSGQAFTVNGTNSATVVIDTNGNISATPASGKVLALGADQSSGSLQFVMNGTDVNNALNNLKTEITSLRTDMTTISTHVHPTTSPGSPTGASLTLTLIPTGSAPNTIPNQSAVVKTL
jgi:hypothetical protein